MEILTPISMWLGPRVSGVLGPFNGHATLGNGLVSYWKLDEQSGTRYDSVTATGNDLTDNNTVTYQNLGPQATAAVFTKANSESLTASSFTGATTFTAAIWLNTAEASDDLDIFGAGTTWPNSVNFHFRTASTGNTMIGLVGSGSGFVQTTNSWPAGGTVKNSGWRLYFLTFDADAKARVYQDGPNLGSGGASAALAGSAFTGPTTVFLGGGLLGNLSQTASRAAYWSRVLSSAEMTSLYNTGVGKSYGALTAAEKTGLVSYWNLDEVSGPRADSHGSNTLTDNNTVTSATNSVPPPNNVAAQFTAANSESLTHVDSVGLSLAGSSFTVSAWLNTTTVVGNGQIAGKYTAAGAKEWLLYRATSAVGLAFSTDGSNFTDQAITTAGVLSPNTWFFVVGWHDLAAGKYFISVNNAAPVEKAGADITDTAQTFGLGGGFAFFDGMLDEVGLWNRALTSQERSDLYASGAGLFY